MTKQRPQENAIAYIGRTIADEFKKVHIIPKTILITLLTVATITYFLLPVVSKHGAEIFIDRVNNPTKEELQKAALIDFKKDSLSKAKNDSLQVILSKINLRHREQIQFKAFQLEKSLHSCVAVNYWSIHNGGETLDVDGRWYLEVYISSRQSNEEDFRDPPPIFPGLRWLGKRTEDLGLVYIEDVRKYPELYQGKTKQQLDVAGVKSFIAIFIKNKAGKERLYASIDFNVYDGLLINPNLFYEVANLKRFILQRIN
jgi:hypothetical protein